jgi:hypothetical protein
MSAQPVSFSGQTAHHYPIRLSALPPPIDIFIFGGECPAHGCFVSSFRVTPGDLGLVATRGCHS